MCSHHRRALISLSAAILLSAVRLDSHTNVAHAQQAESGKEQAQVASGNSPEEIDRLVAEAERLVGAGQHTNAAKAFLQAAWKKYQKMDYSGSERILVRALEILRSSPQPDSKEIARLLTHLSGCQTTQYNYVGAEGSVRDAMKLLEEAGLENTEDYVFALGYASKIQVLQSRVEQSNSFADRATSLARKLGLDIAQHGDVWLAATQARYLRGDYDDAISLANEIKDKLDISGRDQKQYETHGFVLLELADCFSRKGDNERSERYFREYCYSMLRGFGERSPHYASSITALATLYTRIGRHEDALNAARTAQQILTELPKSEPAQLAHVRLLLGKISIKLLKLDEAEELLQSTLVEYRRLFSEKSRYCGDALMYLSDVQLKRGNLKEATRYLADARVILEGTYSAENPNMQYLLEREEALLRKTGKTAEADLIGKRIAAMNARSKESR